MTIAIYLDALNFLRGLLSDLDDLRSCFVDAAASVVPRLQSKSESLVLQASSTGITIDGHGPEVPFESIDRTLPAATGVPRDRFKSCHLILDPSVTHRRQLSTRKLTSRVAMGMADIDRAASTPFRQEKASVLVPQYDAGESGSFYFIAHRGFMDRLSGILSEAGISVGALSVRHGTATLRVIGFAGLPRQGWFRTLGDRWFSILLLGVLVSFGVSALAVKSEVASAMSTIAAKMSELEPAARDARTNLDANLARLKTVSSLRSRSITDGNVVLTIADLTGLLPDGTFLTDLEIDGKNVSISGYSKSASSLIGGLQESGLFAEVRFSSSVTKAIDADGDRFSIAMTRHNAK